MTVEKEVVVLLLLLLLLLLLRAELEIKYYKKNWGLLWTLIMSYNFCLSARPPMHL